MVVWLCPPVKLVVEVKVTLTCDHQNLPSSSSSATECSKCTKFEELKRKLNWFCCYRKAPCAVRHVGLGVCWLGLLLYVNVQSPQTNQNKTKKVVWYTFCNYHEILTGVRHIKCSFKIGLKLLVTSSHYFSQHKSHNCKIWPEYSPVYCPLNHENYFALLWSALSITLQEPVRDEF